MPDIDRLEDAASGRKHDFATMLVEGCSQIQFKRCFFLLVAMVVVFSDFFITTILCQIQGTVFMDNTTTKGTLIQILLVVAMFIAIDLLVEHNIL